MMKSIIYKSLLAGMLFISGILAGCVDNDLSMPGGADKDIYQVEEDEYALGVTISLGKLSGGNTRAALSDLGPNGLKDIEEYVNTENLYILFFNIDGTYLFSINKPTAIPIGQSAIGNDNQWFIKIPVKDINSNLIKYIEENPFKIAVLANWTFDSDYNLGEDLSGWEEFKFNEPLDADGNLTYDEFGKLTGDHISLLSHAQRDKVYENLENHGYDHLSYQTSTGPHMGPYTEWVSNYHNSIKEAEIDIRNNYDVTNNTYSNSSAKYAKDELNHFKIAYNNMWHLWNFGGNDDSRFEFIAADAQKTEWLKLNQKAKEAFWEDGNATASVPKMLHWSMDKYETLEIAPGIMPNSVVDYDYSTGNGPSDEELAKFIGLTITTPNLSWEDHSAGNPLNIAIPSSFGGNLYPYIHFKANADGYLRVNYEAKGGAKLFAHIGQNYTAQTNNQYQRDNKKNRFECTVGDDGQFGDIPFEPKDVYIYMVVDPNYIPPEPEEGMEPQVVEPSVTIYGIEYIESRHLYDVDRRGILPSKDYPIPMYGIQDFDAIGEYWEPGVLFNLSQFNNAQKEGYSYRNISLLRSLSRVEVKLLKSAFPKKPSHVFLRSTNRSARITPVDFFTPTDIIWNGFNPSNISDIKRLQNYIAAGNLNEQHIIENTPGIKGEIENIMQYGPIYIGSNNNQGQSDKQMMEEYRKTTAWPFGIWEKQWGWDWNRGTTLEYFDTYQVGQTRAHTGQTVPEYPRILHTRISRSDYVRMTEVEDPNYYHYIIYIPEKNITDADNPGNIADRPKIAHIEIRFNGGMPDKGNDEDNLVDNFDDNGAYRLYFTEGGRANLGSFNFTGRDSWDAYEYDWDIAKQHWPIMRNHEYIFTVTGSPTNYGNVDLQVSAPDQRFAGWVFY